MDGALRGGLRTELPWGSWVPELLFFLSCRVTGRRPWGLDPEERLEKKPGLRERRSFVQSSILRPSPTATPHRGAQRRSSRGPGWVWLDGREHRGTSHPATGGGHRRRQGGDVSATEVLAPGHHRRSARRRAGAAAGARRRGWGSGGRRRAHQRKRPDRSDAILGGSLVAGEGERVVSRQSAAPLFCGWEGVGWGEARTGQEMPLEVAEEARPSRPGAVSEVASLWRPLSAESGKAKRRRAMPAAGATSAEPSPPSPAITRSASASATDSAPIPEATSSQPPLPPGGRAGPLPPPAPSLGTARPGAGRGWLSRRRRRPEAPGSGCWHG
jgi:hypothetical protein